MGTNRNWLKVIFDLLKLHAIERHVGFDKMPQFPPKYYEDVKCMYSNCFVMYQILMSGVHSESVIKIIFRWFILGDRCNDYVPNLVV